jgi:UDP-N-acetyl-D-mannosaminuronic acid dehydrogenase
MALTIGIVGLGYVGLTLTAALARAGHTVHGVDSQPAVLDTLARGRPHIFEPGVGEVFAELVGRRIFVGPALPTVPLDAVVISVSTPIDPVSRRPELGNLAAAARDIARCCPEGTPVIVRSTVPVGTTRRVVLPVLQERWDRVRLAMAPERTIQGQALRELVELPQVVGGIDAESTAVVARVFGELARRVVPVSGPEAAELVKLANNCHTDLIYAYGNEIALIADQHGLDPLEVIRAANLDYPRPDLAKPGFVGGGCLSKDPFLMLDSAPDNPPFLVGRARELNEYLPVHVAETVVRLLRQGGGTRLSVLGWAYKGWPPTDDMRGSPVTPMMPVFAAAGITVRGHDAMVTDEVIRRHGGEPVDLAKAFRDADGVLLLNDHPNYRAMNVADLVGDCSADARPLFVYDSWRILDEAAVTAAGMRYVGLGYRPDGEPR